MDASKHDEVLDFFYDRKNEKILVHDERSNFSFDEILFFRLIRTLHDDEFLDMTSTGNLSSPEDNVYQISTKGIRHKESGGYTSKQIELIIESDKSAEKENLQLQELRVNVQLLTNQLIDYRKVKSNAKWALIVAAIAAVLSAVQLLLSQM